VEPSGANAVTVCADNVAFRCLCQELRPVFERGSTFEELKRFLRWIPVIEVHLMACESAPAVRAWDFAKLAQERRVCILPKPHAGYLLRSIRGVIADVCRPLIARFGHTSL
jgi:hypothetical protein